MAKTRTRRRKVKAKPSEGPREATAEETAALASLPDPDHPGNGWSEKYIDAAGGIEGWGTAAEVLDLIESVRTVLPDFNRAVRVGGLPVRRIHTVHGPTHGGKTAFVLALLKSFADRGFLSGLIDAEHALGQKFASEMVASLGLATRPNFVAVRPENYEQTITLTDTFLDRAAASKKAHSDAKSILVIDSINKLVPKRELEKILKQGMTDAKGAKELTKAHHGRYRAALNQAWLDQLTPKIARAECALVLIAQEREDHDSTDFFQNFKVKGGAALLFDASLVIRVMKGQPLYLPGGASLKGEEKNAAICGFSHRVRIWKSKVGHMEGRHSDCFFHLSNGKLPGSPPGLDISRDAVKVGVGLGLVKQSGAWYSYRGRRQQGENKAVSYLNRNSLVLVELLDDIAAKLDTIEGRAA